MKVLLVGSSGLIGSALRPFLHFAQYEVSRLVRNSEQKREDTIQWDPDAGTINPDDLEGFDAIVNLAGESIANARWTEEKKQRILESRIKTTRLLANTIAHLKNPPDVWVNASAIGYYGSTGDAVVNEESPNGEGFLAHVCHEWEAATEKAKEANVRIVNLRIGLVLTPKGGMLAKVLTPFKWGLGGMVGSGGQYMSWIAIEDLLGIINHVIDNASLSGPVNAVTPYPVSNFEFTKTLGRVLKRPTVFPMPAFAARLVFGKEMAEETLLASTRAQPEKLIESGYVYHFPRLEKALRHLIT